jgi:GMP synthase-like glutamine amidotransferase
VERILLISHEPEAAPALIGRILTERGYPVDHHVVLADPAAPDTDYPDVADYAAVIAFGSFANAYDDGARAWVAPEVALIDDLVRRDVPYLGVCFGGQLLAESLGGHVERAPTEEQEIGLVTFDDDPDLPIPAGPWFTWHEDRVVLPDGVPVLAHNGRAVQLFRHGRAVGTQFHPEADIDVVGSWVRIGPDHIPEHTSGPELLEDLHRNGARLRANCERLVDWFLHEVAELDRGTA